MPTRTRSSEVPQRPSLRGSNPLRTSSSERITKLDDRRSPRVTQPDSKKLGSRIADLESQLGQAQKELKVLKVQLVSAEVAKKDAEHQTLKKSKKAAVRRPDVPVIDSPPEAEDSKEADSCISGETSDITQQEVEVYYEGSVEWKPEALKDDSEYSVDQLHKGTKPLDASTDESPTKPEQKKPSEESAPKTDDREILKSKLEKKEKELEVRGLENEDLKNQLSEASSQIASAKVKEEEMSLMLSQLGEELETSKVVAAELNGQLEAAKGEKEALEAEIRKMRVHTEQWRKAADAAAAVLAGGVESNGTISDRCGSMDKHLGSSVFHTPADGYTRFVGSPRMADDLDDGLRSGKHKGTSIRMFGDLWRKKGHKGQP